MKAKLSGFLAAWVALAFLSPGSAEEPKVAESADWPQWRGPARDGVAAPGPKLLDAWPKEGPKLLWKSEEIPSVGNDIDGKPARTGGSGSPVVAEGKVFLYVHWRKDTGEKIVVTTPWLKELGWEEGVPDDLAMKIETARLAKERKDLKDAALEKYIADFIAGLDPKPEEKLLDHIKFRLKQGAYACNWRQLSKMSEIRDEEFKTISDLFQAAKGALNTHAHGQIGTKESLVLSGIPLLDKVHSYFDVVLCLDALTGKELWKKEFPGARAGNHLLFAGSSTPSVSGGKCYVAGSAGLYCLSTKDGSVVWQAKTHMTHSSPLVANGRVFMVDGGSNSWSSETSVQKSLGLAAFDAENGKLLWCQPKVVDTEGSPSIWSSGGKNYVLCVSPSGFSCIDPESGAVLWQDRGHISHAFAGNTTPVVRGDIAYLEGCIAYKLTPQKPEVLWKTKGPGSGYGFSPIIYQSYGYYGGKYQVQQCFDLKTGERKWSGSVTRDGNVYEAYECFAPVLAGDKIITYLKKHDWNKYVVMLQATPEKLKEVGIFQPGPNKSPMDISLYASPAVANEKLYVRLSGCLACYDLTEAGK